MAKVSHSHTRSVYVASAPSDRMTLWRLRDFLAACDEQGVPDDAAITAHHSDSTRHFTGVSVRHTTDLTEETPDGS